ncbi:hypothetical protein XENOCAPTIV_027478, partial [Xenoophorus captivus]
LEECESYLLELNQLLKSMEVIHRTYSAPAITALQVSAVAQITLALSENREAPSAVFHVSLKSAYSSLVAEKDRLKHTINLQAPQPPEVIGLKSLYVSDDDSYISDVSDTISMDTFDGGSARHNSGT